MIAMLCGKLLRKKDNEVIIDAGGVGYRVFVAPDELAVLKAEDNITLYTYLNVREDAMQLYGFTSENRLEFFEYLILISGISPKMALTISSAISYKNFRNAIAGENLEELKRLPGVGKKVAQKMILELKDKLADEEIHADTDISEGYKETNIIEAKAALEGLGFSSNEADRILNSAVKTRGKDAGIDELVKYALQHLGGREV